MIDLSVRAVARAYKLIFYRRPVWNGCQQESGVVAYITAAHILENLSLYFDNDILSRYRNEISHNVPPP